MREFRCSGISEHEKSRQRNRTRTIEEMKQRDDDIDDARHSDTGEMFRAEDVQYDTSFAT